MKKYNWSVEVFAPHNLEECVFYYKARHVPSSWKLGCNNFWQHHVDRFNDKFVE